MKIRTLIVDDMRLARNLLRQRLADDAEIEIIGECENGREAIAAIREQLPDLIFLDVQMPKTGGFEVVEAIGAENMPVVIFVTAYDEFALQAFDVSALDYLLKPFNEERLARAVNRAKRQIIKEQSGGMNSRILTLLNEIKPRPDYLERIAVKSAEHTTLVFTEDIDWIGSAGNYLELHIGREIHLIRERISQLESKLSPKKFVRVHRSSIVNIDRIKELHPLFNDDHIIILRDGTKLNLSRTYYPRLKLLLAGF